MWVSVLISFLIGCFIPAAAGRLGKIIPADPGHVIRTICHKPHFPKASSVERSRLLAQKWHKFLALSVIWGIFFAALVGGSDLFLQPEMARYAPIFIGIICLCIVVDSQYFLLPDFLTLPLLLSGFAVSTSVAELSPVASISGALFGYGIALLAGFIMRGPNAELGCGDVKMMTGLGAWLGVTGLNFALVLSFFLFVIPATWRNQRWGAYGPALGMAALIAYFFIYWY